MALLAREEEAKRKALDALASTMPEEKDEATNQSGEAPGIHVTNHVSIADELELGGVQVPDLFGGADGLEPRPPA